MFSAFLYMQLLSCSNICQVMLSKRSLSNRVGRSGTLFNSSYKNKIKNYAYCHYNVETLLVRINMHIPKGRETECDRELRKSLVNTIYKDFTKGFPELI